MKMIQQTAALATNLSEPFATRTGAAIHYRAITGEKVTKAIGTELDAAVARNHQRSRTALRVKEAHNAAFPGINSLSGRTALSIQNTPIAEAIDSAWPKITEAARDEKIAQFMQGEGRRTEREKSLRNVRANLAAKVGRAYHERIESLYEVISRVLDLSCLIVRSETLFH